MFARFIAVVVVSSTVLAGAASAADKRPNIVMILADNLGKDWFGCYGADGNHTPNVDKLAVGGTRFRHCWSTALCSTTRVELWTGRYPFHTGWTIHHDAAIYGGGYLDWRRETSLARVMQAGGYSTCITGKWQINDLYEQTDALKQHGFDEHFVWTGALLGEGTAEPRWKKQGDSHHEFESRYWDPVVFNNGKREEYPGRFGPDMYVDRLVDFMARHRDRPFFAFYSCPLVHVPTVPTPDTPTKDAPEREQFAGMVHYMDKQVGRIVSELERLGLRENTIVIFTTDNGTPKRLGGTMGGKTIPGGLGGLSEPGLDVPLVVNCPGRVAAGKVAGLADDTDFFPTIAELAGVPIPSHLVIDGHSFAAQLDQGGNPAPQREWIFTEYNKTRVIRDEQYKLYSTGEFFDVSKDLLEKNNLASSTDPTVVAARQKLQKVLDGLPPDIPPPFKPRSSSAFQIERKG